MYARLRTILRPHTDRSERTYPGVHGHPVVPPLRSPSRRIFIMSANPELECLRLFIPHNPKEVPLARIAKLAGFVVLVTVINQI